MPDAAYFRKQAETCRKLAGTLLDKEAAATLRGMAADYERQATKLEGRAGRG